MVGFIILQAVLQRPVKLKESPHFGAKKKKRRTVVVLAIEGKEQAAGKLFVCKHTHLKPVARRVLVAQGCPMPGGGF